MAITFILHSVNSEIDQRMIFCGLMCRCIVKTMQSNLKSSKASSVMQRSPNGSQGLTESGNLTVEDIASNEMQKHPGQQKQNDHHLVTRRLSMSTFSMVLSMNRGRTSASTRLLLSILMSKYQMVVRDSMQAFTAFYLTVVKDSAFHVTMFEFCFGCTSRGLNLSAPIHLRPAVRYIKGRQSIC